MTATPRYLVPFHPKQTAHFFTDILIIGGGLAGLRAALAVPPELSVLVVTKDALRQSNSSYAQGGIASVIDPEDRFEDHIADTLVAGVGLCDDEVVDMVVREAPQHIADLIAWGTHFDETATGDALLLGREGGHSHHRIVHALGDATGKEVMRAVIDWTERQRHITIWEHAFTLDLLTSDGVCRGALINTRDHGRIMVWAKQTIIATGGAGQVYRESTNPVVATADGHALAYRAGVELRDMEFMQFHPTVLYIAGGSRSLITEAVRGEGAYLIDKNGKRFMPEYDSRAELAPRDIVSQSIVSQMEKTQHSCVYLDLSHLDAKFVRQRFPHIAEACLKFGLDIAVDPIPVRPGAHYMIGGLTVDMQGKTSMEGLWAAGEVSSSGLHGANRLASNSLLEGLVYGAHAGSGASAAAQQIRDDFHALPLENPSHSLVGEPLDLLDIRNSLKAVMWRSAGVRRSGELLEEAAESIDNWRKYVLVRQFDTQDGWELQNMLTVARIMVAAALAREESRGTHLRTDFREPQEVWKRHLHVRRAADGNEMQPY
jgi:L-aspartate oxidase